MEVHQIFLLFYLFFHCYYYYYYFLLYMYISWNTKFNNFKIYITCNLCSSLLEMLFLCCFYRKPSCKKHFGTLINLHLSNLLINCATVVKCVNLFSEGFLLKYIHNKISFNFLSKKKVDNINFRILTYFNQVEAWHASKVENLQYINCRV